MDLRPADQDEALKASERLVADVRASMSDPERPLASPLDRIIATLTDPHQVYRVQAEIDRTDDRELQKSLHWFTRGLSIQQIRLSERDMSLSRTIGRVTMIMQYTLIAVGFVVALLGYFPQFEDDLVLAGYIMMGSAVPVTVIGTTIWRPIRKRADKARLTSVTLDLIARFDRH